MKWFDDFFEKQTRQIAQQTSRRSALLKIGKALLGHQLAKARVSNEDAILDPPIRIPHLIPVIEASGKVDPAS